MSESFQKSIVDEGLAIFGALKHERESFFDKDYWFGRMMEWVMKDPSFKVDLFRFVDVLPMLTTNDQVAKHIKEYLLKEDREIPAVMNTALKAASFSFAKGVAASVIRKNVTEMAERFIAGRNINDAKPVLQSLEKEGFTFTIDILGEKTLSDVEADSYLTRYIELITTLPTVLRNYDKNNPPNVSLKISALSSNLREEDPEAAVFDLYKRVIPLLRAAKTHNVFINFDVESFQTHEIIYQLFEHVALEDEFKTWPHLGIVVQAYLKDTEHCVLQLIKIAETRKTPITVRLVKGAYWDYEVVKALLEGHRVPVFLKKALTDLSYEATSRKLLDHCHVLRPAFGSHNIRSLAHAIAYAKEKAIAPTAYEIQMLFGMANAEMRALKARGHQVRIYVPIGEILPGMSYLVRRLLENTSQMGFLKLSHHDQTNEASLLREPLVNLEEVQKTHDFVNAPRTDFTDKKAREGFAFAIEDTQKILPVSVAITIDGIDYAGENKFEKVSPNDLTKKIVSISLASIKEAELAVSAADASFAAIKKLTIEERASHLESLAEILNADRAMLAAIMCHEVGKTWAEADADVAEAIDFCRYYASRARVELAPQKMGNFDGEHNLLTFLGRGPTVVIAPWNFPLAILCGMSVAAYVAGNPIIMKPAEQSTLTARMLFDRMIKAQFLKEALHFLPGKGEELGPYLVSHKKIANICFTGSMKVGHEIIKAANTVESGQIQMKRVICEMGGKNTIIVDEDADLDEAVSASIVSAFGYAGQKCSAASRIVVVGTIKDQFVRRLVEAANSLRAGLSTEASTFLGPVIEQEAYARLLLVQEKLKHDESITVLQTGMKREGGYFVPTMVVLAKDPHHFVMQDELFGPIIAIHHAADLKTAIDVANNTKYALTGAIFSRSPTNIAYAREEFAVGNLYVNQKSTGAIVARQPFGGFKMSGTGIKAGGPHYLLNLVDMKLVSENTMRRGFTPEVSI